MTPSASATATIALPLVLTLATPTLGAQTSPGQLPPKRAHHALVYDDAGGRVLLTGGSSPFENGACCAFFNDLWAFDGTRWTALAPSGIQMSGMRLVFDTDARRVVSFGGYSNGRSLPVLRARVAGAWQTLLSNDSIPAAEAGFVYDARRKRFVAFGGSGGRGDAHGTTWEFDGTRWTRFAGASPAARQAHAMVYDERRGRTVVFGGMRLTAPGQPRERLADVWEFDGATWTQKRVTGGPTGRESQGVAYDSKRGVVLAFGGGDASGFRNDLWAWNGSTWTQLDAGGAGRPDARAMGYIAYDRKRDRVVLFGGRNGWPKGDLNDTWEWDGRRWTRVGG
jgi:hypothetical protein